MASIIYPLGGRFSSVGVGGGGGSGGAGVLHPIHIGVSDPYDPEARAFLTAANITDGTQQLAINGLVLELKLVNLWTKIVALYPFVGGAATPHSFNLKNPAQYQITWSGTVTHNSAGVQGDGSTGWGNSHVPRSALGVVLIHGIVDLDIVNPPFVSGVYMGQDHFGVDDNSYFHLYYTGQQQVNISSPPGGVTANTAANGVFIGTRRTGFAQALPNGASSFTESSSPDAISTSGDFIYLLALNRNNVAVAPTNHKVRAMGVGTGLLLSEAIAYRTALTNYKTALGR